MQMEVLFKSKTTAEKDFFLRKKFFGFHEKQFQINKIAGCKKREANLYLIAKFSKMQMEVLQVLFKGETIAEHDFFLRRNFFVI